MKILLGTPEEIRAYENSTPIKEIKEKWVPTPRHYQTPRYSAGRRYKKHRSVKNLNDAQFATYLIASKRTHEQRAYNAKYPEIHPRSCPACNDELASNKDNWTAWCHIVKSVIHKRNGYFSE